RPDGVNALDPAGGTDWEGIYTDPANADARRHTIDVFEDIVRRYRVGGLHYDYVRYPQVTYASSADDHAHVDALVRESATRLRAVRAAKARSCSRTIRRSAPSSTFSPRPDLRPRITARARATDTNRGGTCPGPG